MKKAIDGLILRDTKSGENDKLLTVLTSEGKLFMTAKGARSMRSKVKSICCAFTYANIEYYEKKGLHWLSGGSSNESFLMNDPDLEGAALAAYVCQIADEITAENVEADQILRMTLNTLYCIDRKQKPYVQIKAVYELFAAIVSGFAPDLHACAECGCKENGFFWLDVMNGQLFCEDCVKKRSNGIELPETDEYNARNILMPLDASALASMRYICSAPPQKIFSFSLSSDESMKYLCRAAETYLLNHLERGFDTLTFYHTVTK